MTRPVHYLRMPGIEILCNTPWDHVPFCDKTRSPEDVTCPECLEILAHQVAQTLDPITIELVPPDKDNQ